MSVSCDNASCKFGRSILQEAGASMYKQTESNEVKLYEAGGFPLDVDAYAGSCRKLSGRSFGHTLFHERHGDKTL
jgi:hypothetical protein